MPCSRRVPIRPFRLLLAATAALCIGGLPIAAQVAPSSGDPMRGSQPDSQAAFQRWVDGFRQTAIRAGVSGQTLERELSGLTFNPRVVSLDRQQPDDSGPSAPPKFTDYLERRLTPARIRPGERLYEDAAPMLAAVEREYGVPGEIILAIFGMETAYGAVTGDFDVVRSLASLAFDGRREALFTEQLIGALKMIDRGVTTRGQMTGSWAGAMGNSQFLPTSYLDHAVDFDGDDRPDIWNSRADTFASIANYLKDAGWRPGTSWGMRVAVPADFDRTRVRDLVRPESCERVLEKHSRWIPVAEWKALGLTPLDGGSFPGDDVLATLVEVDGPGTGAYLTYGNYRALLGYNCSNFYALSVGLLADEIVPPGGAAASGAAGGMR